MGMKHISLIIFFLGIIFVVYSVTKESSKCPPPQIKYKFVQKSFDQQQDTPVELNKIYGKMFKDPSPWVGFSFESAEMSDFKDISQ